MRQHARLLTENGSTALRAGWLGRSVLAGTRSTASGLLRSIFRRSHLAGAIIVAGLTGATASAQDVRTLPRHDAACDHPPRRADDRRRSHGRPRSDDGRQPDDRRVDREREREGRHARAPDRVGPARLAGPQGRAQGRRPDPVGEHREPARGRWPAPAPCATHSACSCSRWCATARPRRRGSSRATASRRSTG